MKTIKRNPKGQVKVKFTISETETKDVVFNEQEIYEIVNAYWRVLTNWISGVYFKNNIKIEKINE